MLGPLRPHVYLRLLREREGRISKAENGEHLDDKGRKEVILSLT